MNAEIRELMEKNFLNNKNFSYGSYTGQTKCLRKLAIEKFGANEVAMMSDWQIEKEFKKLGLVPVCVCFENGCDHEMIYLIPIEKLDELETLSR